MRDNPPPLAAPWGFELWRVVMRWQRAVDAALRPLGLTHTQYLVLASAARASWKQNDAVTQTAIGNVAGLDRATVGAVIRTLDERGLLDRGNDGLDRRKWRVIVTGDGENVLEKASRLIEATQTRALRDAARLFGDAARAPGEAARAPGDAARARGEAGRAPGASRAGRGRRSSRS